MKTVKLFGRKCGLAVIFMAVTGTLDVYGQGPSDLDKWDRENWGTPQRLTPDHVATTFGQQRGVLDAHGAPMPVPTAAPSPLTVGVLTPNRDNETAYSPKREGSARFSESLTSPMRAPSF